jgi:multidrug resistance efflux pump
MSRPSSVPSAPPGKNASNGAASMWSWDQSWLGHAGAPRLHTSALQAAQTPRMARLVMVGSLLVLVGLALAMVFVPWQQTVTGSGQVTAFAPEARPRTVESAIPARVREWRVVEGESVAAGDTIAVLEDIDSAYLDDRFNDRIAEQRTSTMRALRLDAEQAREKLSQARQKLRSAEAKVDNAGLEATTARQRLRRVETLHEEGLASLRDLETAQLKLRKARADSTAAAADLEAARSAVASARMGVNRKESEIEAKQSDLDLKVENARERQAASIVTAPVAGTVARINRPGPGQTVKKGGALALIVPETTDQAVEIFVNSVDAAIVEPGRQVQLQFAGFPALQFAGFPGASVGTFPGRVRLIDPVDDGKGRYRVVVVPDTTDGQPDWPSSSYLRQGSSVTGSVLLSDVSLGYEIWRRLNGLPPQVPVRDKSFAGQK